MLDSVPPMRVGGGFPLGLAFLSGSFLFFTCPYPQLTWGISWNALFAVHYISAIVLFIGGAFCRAFARASIGCAICIESVKDGSIRRGDSYKIKCFMIYNKFFVGFLAIAMAGAPSLGVFASTHTDDARFFGQGGLREQFIKPSALRMPFDANQVLVRFKGSDRFTRVPVTGGDTIERVLSEYQKRGDVLYAEPNYIATSYAVPNDPYYGYQWHLDNATKGGIHTEAAWNVTQGAGVTVAVVDTGIAYENYSIYYRAPDFASTSFVSGYDFVNNDSHPNDDNGHGTHVAGTVAQSTNNSVGVAGIAYKASLMPVKVLNKNGSGSYADVADGIRWAADNGAQVINLSLGGPSSSNALRDAVAYAYNKGVTIVAASGNDNGAVGYPAAYDEYVIAVGATRFDEQRAPYSNYGSSLDIVAPGGDLNVDQNADGYGDGVLQQTFSGNPRVFGYYFFQGTSMATPHVAGVAALVIANGNATSPNAVRAALETTADDLGIAGIDAYYGNGLVNAASALAYRAGPVDNPPTVSITSPLNGAIATGTVMLAADARDDMAVTQVDFYIDTILLGSDFSAPYGISWDTTLVSDGNHTVKSVAVDSAAQTAHDSVSVTVDNIYDPVVTVFSDSFEVSEWNGLWTQDLQNDWFRSSQRASSGTRSAEVDGSANDAALMSQIIPMPAGKTTARISFDWFIENGLDLGEYIAMDVSADGGGWVEHARLRGDVDQENIWHSIASQINATSTAQIRFRGKMSLSNEDANVDNVKVTAE